MRLILKFFFQCIKKNIIWYSSLNQTLFNNFNLTYSFIQRNSHLKKKSVHDEKLVQNYIYSKTYIHTYIQFTVKHKKKIWWWISVLYYQKEELKN